MPLDLRDGQFNRLLLSWDIFYSSVYDHLSILTSFVCFTLFLFFTLPYLVAGGDLSSSDDMDINMASMDIRNFRFLFVCNLLFHSLWSANNGTFSRHFLLFYLLVFDSNCFEFRP